VLRVDGEECEAEVVTGDKHGGEDEADMMDDQEDKID
jgi:hypothetical protein